ncbi:MULTISPECIES: hypothetical protein [Pseudomonas]|uniref:Uncharacterized protein n=1 Tax=Pseudomonas putida TaxID=303 RepID=A0A1B2F966_PSEPU|nr:MULTISPECIES: hypothetical protein [Pseudomonas]ANY88731.1 hypothetical protein IEC33019_3199 [Pseudomonas putida]MCL8305604.1 hypothetical protein [Pseudomonas putida]
MITASFTAELHCQYGRIGVAHTQLEDHFVTSADIDGWLCTQESKHFKPMRFLFTFQRQTQTRTYYRITCADSWQYRGAELRQNNNGWLGVYGTHVVGRMLDALNPINLLPSTTWKIDMLDAWNGDPNSAAHKDFYLRNSDGFRVARSTLNPHREAVLNGGSFLNASSREGDVLVCRLSNIELLDV